MFNSIVTKMCAFDLDGIICHDETTGGVPGTPLYLPRREPVHIITGRPQRDRKVTLGWLARWGVLVASLTMGRWDECPEWEEIAEYKADAVRRFAVTAHDRPFGPPMYVESCPRQANRIADRAGVLTACPANAELLMPDATGNELMGVDTRQRHAHSGTSNRAESVGKATCFIRRSGVRRCDRCQTTRCSTTAVSAIR